MNSTHFSTHGYALIEHVIPALECAAVSAKLAILRNGSAGARGLLPQAWCRRLVAQLRNHGAIATLVPVGFVAVQCTYFEKSLERNWLVPIHQDLSIPVAERLQNPSLHGWSEKEGSLYVQVPTEILEELVAVRLHLDDCGPLDGPLRVVPGSHRLGRVESQAALEVRRAQGEFVCTAERGSVLVMRPLLLHSSSKAAGQSMRRTLHFLFGPAVLPWGLRWLETL